MPFRQFNYGNLAFITPDLIANVVNLIELFLGEWSGRKCDKLRRKALRIFLLQNLIKNCFLMTMCKEGCNYGLWDFTRILHLKESVVRDLKII